MVSRVHICYHFQDVVFFFAIVLAGFVLRQYFVSQIKGSKSHKLLLLRQILQIFVKLGDRNCALEKSLSVTFACSFNGPLDGSLAQQTAEKTIKQLHASCITVTVVHITIVKDYETNKNNKVVLKENSFLSCLAANFVLTIVS